MCLLLSSSVKCCLLMLVVKLSCWSLVPWLLLPLGGLAPRDHRMRRSAEPSQLDCILETTVQPHPASMTTALLLVVALVVAAHKPR